MKQCIGLVVALFFLTAMLSGCYRIEVQQGNVITPADAKAIKKGMSEAQVKRRLGTPVLSNIYRNYQMIYVYTLRPEHGQFQKRSLIIYFLRNRVSRVKARFGKVNLPKPVSSHKR